jgi:hypothetical protein
VLGNYWVAEQLAASQGLSSVELIISSMSETAKVWKLYYVILKTHMYVKRSENFIAENPYWTRIVYNQV